MNGENFFPVNLSHNIKILYVKCSPWSCVLLTLNMCYHTELT